MMSSVPTIDDILDPRRILDVMHECENGVRWKASTQRFEVSTLRWAASIYDDVQNGSYRSKGFKRFDIMERGKLRHIQSVHISERVVQKLLCRYVLTPTIYPKLIYDNSASQPGKGTNFAIKRLVEHLRWHLARHGKSGAIAVIDYQDYFNSIPHDKVISSMCVGQEDLLLMKYIADFVNAFDGDTGLGLGSETSQVGAIDYPTPIDKLVKDQLGVHCYARYMDDSYIIHNDRGYVEHCLRRIKDMAERLGIAINDSKTVVHNMSSDDFTFLKKRIHVTDNHRIVIRLTRKNVRDERMRIRDLRNEYDHGRIGINSILQSYQAWRRYAKTYNAYGVVGNMDGYFVTIMGDALRARFGDERISFDKPPRLANEDDW